MVEMLVDSSKFANSFQDALNKIAQYLSTCLNLANNNLRDQKLYYKWPLVFPKHAPLICFYSCVSFLIEVLWKTLKIITCCPILPSNKRGNFLSINFKVVWRPIIKRLDFFFTIRTQSTLGTLACHFSMLITLNESHGRQHY